MATRATTRHLGSTRRWAGLFAIKRVGMALRLPATAASTTLTRSAMMDVFLDQSHLPQPKGETMIDAVWKGIVKSEPGMWTQARENALEQAKNRRENYDMLVDMEITTNIDGSDKPRILFARMRFESMAGWEAFWDQFHQDEKAKELGDNWINATESSEWHFYQIIEE